MKDRSKNQRAPVCPSCGQPVRPGFLHFRINDTVKLVLVVLLLGYVILSVMLLALSAPAEFRKGCGSFDPRWQIPFIAPNPDRCRETDFDKLMEPVYHNPAFQIFVGSGVVLGVLIFYWDGVQQMYENWQKKREAPLQKQKNAYKHKCRYCGRQWN